MNNERMTQEQLLVKDWDADLRKQKVAWIVQVWKELLRDWFNRGQHYILDVWEDEKEWAMEVEMRMERSGTAPEEQHGAWMRSRVENGWTYGPIHSKRDRQSPFMVPFDRLPEIHRKRYRLFCALVDSLSES